MSSARSITCASKRDRRAPARRSRSHRNTARSSSYTPNLRVGLPARALGGVGVAPRVLGRGVEAGAREVEADGRARCAGATDLGSSRVRTRRVWALPSNPPMSGRDLVERPLAVVAERGVSEVVREARGVDDVGVAPEQLAELAPDLRDLERVREARADEVARAGGEHLRLRAEPPQRGAVDDARAVALERRARRALGGLRRPSARRRRRRSRAGGCSPIDATGAARCAVFALPLPAGGGSVPV